MIRERRSYSKLISLVAVAVTLLIATATPVGAGAEFQFPRPASIEPNIKFWTDIFTAYSYRDFVIHDRDHIERVYAVVHLPGSGAPSREQAAWINAYLKAKYSGILRNLAAGHPPTYSEERKVAGLINPQSVRDYAIAADNLRVQQGMRERFRETLVRGRAYQPLMERILVGAGLPRELAILPSVESGFSNQAHSSAGAVGMWQFTGPTGRQFMTITRGRDDRLNPIRSTQAAAKLLRLNYETLGDWPLAITAYNYGTNGMARAASRYGTDFSTILRRYDGSRFGFASRNYYAEFLAALQIHRYEEAYFPGISRETPPPMQLRSASYPRSHLTSRKYLHRATLNRRSRHRIPRQKSA